MGVAMKRNLAVIVTMFLLIFLSACAKPSLQVESGESQHTHTEIPVDDGVERITYTGVISEQIVINTEKEVEITLADVSATMSGSVVTINNAKNATIILVGENNLASTGDPVSVEPKVINSAVDVTMRGEGTLNIASTHTAIKSKANLTIESGVFNLAGGDDGNGLRADRTLTINGGTFNISAGECLEATYIEINDGDLKLSSPDDAINASNKIDDQDATIIPVLTINGGNIIIAMDQGDTDAIDSNGDIVINNGFIDITAQSGFDWDGNLAFNGGTVVINGQMVTEISNQLAAPGATPPGEFESGPPPGEPADPMGAPPPEFNG